MKYLIIILICIYLINNGTGIFKHIKIMASFYMFKGQQCFYFSEMPVLCNFFFPTGLSIYWFVVILYVFWMLILCWSSIWTNNLPSNFWLIFLFSLGSILINKFFYVIEFLSFLLGFVFSFVLFFLFEKSLPTQNPKDILLYFLLNVLNFCLSH